MHVLGVRTLSVIFLVLCCSACIPYKIAPSIKTYKVMKTKRFIKQLPFRYGIVFKDPNDAGEFYQFVNINLADTTEWSAINLPFQLEGTRFIFPFMR